VADQDHPTVADSRDAVTELWATARAVEDGAAALAAWRDFDNDLRFTVAASHCGEAADELQRAHPDIWHAASPHGFAVDFRRTPIDDATRVLLAALADGIASFDVDDLQLTPADLLAAGTAATWLAMAHHAISGRLP
jgi:hypothetical protein